MVEFPPASLNDSIIRQIDVYYQNVEQSYLSKFKNINILRKDELKDKTFNKKIFSLSYPVRWISPILSSPFSKTIEDKTIQWMKKLGLVPSDRVEENIRKMQLRHYAGYSHSLASYDHSLVYCKCITLWLFWDDVEVELANDLESVMPSINSLAGKSPNTADLLNPFVVGFKEIGDDYERLGASRKLRQRFADGMKEWAKIAIQEEAVWKSNQSRTLQEAIYMRFLTIGVRAASILVERAVGIEIPDEILKDPLYLKCIDSAAVICGIGNDLVSVGKDLSQNRIKSNVVLLHFDSTGESLEKAYEVMISIRDKAIADFDSYTDELLKRVNNEWYERLHCFFMSLRYLDSGFDLWHQDCIRYQEFLVTENDDMFEVRVKTQ